VSCQDHPVGDVAIFGNCRAQSSQVNARRGSLVEAGSAVEIERSAADEFANRLLACGSESASSSPGLRGKGPIPNVPVFGLERYFQRTRRDVICDQCRDANARFT
jgi:hypothetical protein